MKRKSFNFPSFLWGTLVGTILGLGGYAVYKYFSEIFQRPRLVSKAVFSDQEAYDSVESRALFIAAENLRSGVIRRRLADGQEKLALHAGYRNFREIWARDFGFACYGLLALKEYTTARETIEAFLTHQNVDGQFPVKLHSASVLNRFLHSFFERELPTESPIKPKYLTGHRTVSLDGHSLLIVAALTYVEQSEDDEFGGAYWHELKRGLDWLKGHTQAESGLIHQDAFADWADSVIRQGPVLYTNVVYWKALREMAKAATDYGSQREGERLAERRDQVRDAIQKIFWRSDLGYFVTSPTFENLSSGGNLLAVAWGLASPKQGHSVLGKMRAARMASPVPTQAADKPYPNRYIALENRLGGLAHYHTDASWLWLGAWHVIALARLGKFEQAKKHLNRIAEVIVKDGEVHEVYGEDGEYLSNFWYTSEAPLTWSAGMVVYAYHVLEDRLEFSKIPEMIGLGIEE